MDMGAGPSINVDRKLLQFLFPPLTIYGEARSSRQWWNLSALSQPLPQNSRRVKINLFLIFSAWLHMEVRPVGDL